MSEQTGAEGAPVWVNWPVSLFEKFAERTRKVLTLAAEEAARLHHSAIGVEHLLLGLIDEDEGVAAQALRNLGVDLQRLYRSVVALLNQTSPQVEEQTKGEVDLTGEAKRVLERAVQEARLLRHHYVGAEHLLLGLLRKDDGPAAQARAGVTLEKARAQVVQILAGMRREAGSGGAKNTVIACRVEDRDLDAIDALIETGIRTTRSDAASWLISVGIQAQQELFERVYEMVAEIHRLRGQAQDIARQVMERQAPRVYKEDGPQQAEQGS